MKPDSILYGKKVYLRHPAFDEISFIRKLWGDPETMDAVGGPIELQEPRATEWFERMVEPGSDQNCYLLIFNEDDIPVGEINFHNWEPAKGVANLNIKILASHRGKGYGKDALLRFLSFFFGTVGGKILNDDVALKNKPGQALLSSIGFEQDISATEACRMVMTKKMYSDLHENQKKIISIRNDCSIEHITPPYQSIVEEAVVAFRETVGGELKEIRLLGSVARGTAIAGQSDIDFMAILDTPPTEKMRSELQKRALSIHKRYPIVSKVDLDWVVYDNIGKAQRFIISTDSVSIYGKDSLTEARVEIAADELAGLVSPDLSTLLPKYMESVKSIDVDDEQALFQWSRWCGKDILKCLRKRAIMEEAKYEREIEKIFNQISPYFLEQRKLLQTVYSLYSDPKPDKNSILEVLQRVSEDFMGDLR